MESKKAVWGNRIEIAGMIVVFAATVAQIQLTDWWDDQLRDWQAMIQEGVNLAELKALSDLAWMLREPDENKRISIANEIYDRTGAAYFKAIEQRDERLKVKERGQAALFSNIKSSLLLLGSALLAFGKMLSDSSRKSEKSRSDFVGDPR